MLDLKYDKSVQNYNTLSYITAMLKSSVWMRYD